MQSLANHSHDIVTQSNKKCCCYQSASQQQVREVRAKLQHEERQNEELHGELDAAQHLAKERERVIEECKKLSAECSRQVSQIRVPTCEKDTNAVRTYQKCP